jgi:hypothetical protein
MIETIDCHVCGAKNALQIRTYWRHQTFNVRTGKFERKKERDCYCTVCCHSSTGDTVPTLQPLKRLLRSRAWDVLEK